MSEIDKYKTCEEDFQVTDSKGKPMFFKDGTPIMAHHFDLSMDDTPPAIPMSPGETEALRKKLGLK